MSSDMALSIAIPSSFWYLKNYPLKDIQVYLDYLVFMTYDIYGVWDMDKDNKIKCHTNKTAIIDSLKMLDKAQIQMSKVYGGLANYGRSYKASSSSCMSENCAFSGPGNSRDITNTPGVLAESEINSISSSSAKIKRWSNNEIMCDFMVYDGDSIVAWPKGGQRDSMRDFFHTHGLKGFVLWVDNYFNHEKYTGEDDPYINCDITNEFSRDTMNFRCVDEKSISKRSSQLYNYDLPELFEKFNNDVNDDNKDLLNSFFMSQLSILIDARTILRDNSIPSSVIDPSNLISLEHMYYFWTHLTKDYLRELDSNKENAMQKAKDYVNMLTLVAPNPVNILDGTLEECVDYLSTRLENGKFHWGNVENEKLPTQTEGHRNWLDVIINDESARNKFYTQMINIITSYESYIEKEDNKQLSKRHLLGAIVNTGSKALMNIGIGEGMLLLAEITNPEIILIDIVSTVAGYNLYKISKNTVFKDIGTSLKNEGRPVRATAAIALDSIRKYFASSTTDEKPSTTTCLKGLLVLKIYVLFLSKVTRPNYGRVETPKHQKNIL